MNLNRHFKPGNLLKVNSFVFSTTAFSYGDFKPYRVSTDIAPGDFVVWLKTYSNEQKQNNWFYGLHSNSGRIVLLCITNFDMTVS